MDFYFYSGASWHSELIVITALADFHLLDYWYLRKDDTAKPAYSDIVLNRFSAIVAVVVALKMKFLKSRFQTT